jgi:MFS-type transporter involved in bile tolerance (Atg22 family)
LDQDPGDAAIYNSIIAIPFSIKVFFGIISDNIKIFGLRRKPYLIFFAFVQAIVMFCLFYFDSDSVLVVVLLLTLASLTNAFSNVVIEAILVV